ncbi:(3S)-malyl-CoA thioesterase [Arthrobacter woluwensis]|uniref:(3S)-malyl-CoA thioesterase n=3 Tax=Arthrobacter woluwensis TaxID=156980 RepID=A0A1H4SED0_9MICC|nr:(3S)-malyl-CoA thioesterase [Arthrobacter woluwensis]
MVTLLDDQRLARACADAMWSTDRASKGLGMTLERVEPGRAVLSMTVRAGMVNGHGICHGGFISTLADSTFAFSCNTRNVVTVAAGFEIDFLEAAHLGDVLRADGREVVLRGRSGIYDVTVRRGDTVVALFRGRSRSLGRPILEETP